jgi:hypothetical protein
MSRRVVRYCRLARSLPRFVLSPDEEDAMKKSETDPSLELPWELGPSSNGEVAPAPRTPRDDHAEEEYRRLVDRQARRLGLSRRQFMDSACGAAAALVVVNQVMGCNGSGDGTGASARGAGGIGGFTRDAGYDVPADVRPEDAARAAAEAGYDVPRDALDSPDRANAVLAGDEFIFDVQVHNQIPAPPWGANICTARNPNLCPTDFLKELFVASDNAVACLSGYPSDDPPIATRGRIKQLIDALDGSPRLLMHANVRSVGGASLDAMESNAKTYPVAAWKCYPDLGRLDSPALDPFFERARRTGVKVVASHRGLGRGASYAADPYLDTYSPRDLVAAAKKHPDITFLCYHGGYDSGTPEARPYNKAAPLGLDRLIAAMDEFGNPPNVYAELGSTWNNLRKDPAEAAHGLGKLLKYLGPDRIVWGTDAVLTGRPQEQIQAFRAFQIPQSMQETFGYPALTAEVKRKILGLNAARVYGVDPAVLRRKLTNDEIDKIKLAHRADPRSVPMPRHRPHGPRTRREYWAFLDWERWRG